MEEKQIAHNGKENIVILLCALLSVGANALACFIYEMDMQQLISQCVLVALGGFLLFFSLKQELLYDRFLHKETDGIQYFAMFYILALLIAVFVPKLPVAIWPYLVIYLMLSMFSNTVSGIVAATICLMISVSCISGGQLSVFLMYFFSGTATVIFFRNLDQEYKIAYPILMSELVQVLCLVFYSGYTLSFDVSIILFAFVNVVCSFLLALVVLKCYSSLVMHKYRNKYMELCDTENPLLIAVKKTSLDTYFKAVHVAYFCDRLCNRLDCDSVAVKTAAYYHNSVNKNGEADWETTKAFCNENAFPPEVTDILREFLDKKSRLHKTESVILYMSESVISTILGIVKSGDNSPIDFEKVIGAIFDQKMKSGVFNEADITVKQLEIMKKTFVEEKLYYDFLR